MKTDNHTNIPLEHARQALAALRNDQGNPTEKACVLAGQFEALFGWQIPSELLPWFDRYLTENDTIYLDSLKLQKVLRPALEKLTRTGSGDCAKRRSFTQTRNILNPGILPCRVPAPWRAPQSSLKELRGGVSIKG
ncbi:MAG: hypothetical protein GY754_16690 [bacterium]|nr:hypothetical protein [bacterium]